MLRWSFTFLVVALIAGALGMTGVAGAAAGIAKALFVGFLILFAVTAFLGVTAGRRIAGHRTPTVRRDHDLTHHR